MRQRIGFVATTLILASHASAQIGDKDATATDAPFAAASVRFEQNVTDADVEVVFEITAGDEGVGKLAVVAPDGRIVVDFSAPAASTLGMRKFLFESPEPKDVESLKAAYPEGVYTITGTSASGSRLRGSATLRHGLPPTVSFLQPRPDAKGVPVRNATIAWKSVEPAATYIVEIEAEDQDVSLATRLPGSASQLAVPEGFLAPDTEYKLAIGTVTTDGNTSFVEMSFTTAAGK